MPKPPAVEISDRATRSPELPELVMSTQEIDDEYFPAASELTSVTAVEDWIVRADDALTEARNGVTAISWPLALAGLVGVLALWADVADSAPILWLAVTASPWKSGLSVLLLVMTVAAFWLSNETTEKRKKLVAIRSAYLRRRRDLAAAQLGGREHGAGWTGAS